MISRIALPESADASTVSFAREVADQLARADANDSTGAIAILGVGDPYALRLDDPSVRVVVPLLRGHRPDPVAREQIRWAHALVVTDETERRWLQDIAITAAVVVGMTTHSSPLAPSSPVERHAVLGVLQAYDALCSSIDMTELDERPATFVAEACLECALAVALDAENTRTEN